MVFVDQASVSAIPPQGNFSYSWGFHRTNIVALASNANSVPMTLVLTNWAPSTSDATNVIFWNNGTYVIAPHGTQQIVLTNRQNLGSGTLYYIDDDVTTVVWTTTDGGGSNFNAVATWYKHTNNQ
jgi:hypothetical protein